jgi:hypothetical protein
VALTNEPFLTKLPDAVVLADDQKKIYLDYEEDEKNMEKEKLLEENNSLLKKLADTLTGFVEKFKPGQGSGLSDDDKKKLAELETVKAELAAAKTDQEKIKTSMWVTMVDGRIKDLVAKGIPPVMCEQTRAILLANPVYETTMIKLADGKEISKADQMYAILEALPTEHRIKMGQIGAQTSPLPADSPEAIKKMADEDVKALGGKVTENGKYTL